MSNEPPGNDLAGVARAFADGARPRNNPVDVLKLTGKAFHMKAHRCNLGLKGTITLTCQAETLI